MQSLALSDTAHLAARLSSPDIFKSKTQHLLVPHLELKAEDINVPTEGLVNLIRRDSLWVNLSQK